MTDSLELIAREIECCTRCPLYELANKAVPGEGPIHARIFFVGQAPGVNEDRTGRPFVGRAGRFLNAMLAEIGLERRWVFLTGAVKHFPPRNRAPRADELNECRQFLVRQIAVVNPNIVVLMGRAAESIMDHPVLAGKRVIVTVHPSAAMRFPAMRSRMKQDFQQLKQAISSDLNE